MNFSHETKNSILTISLSGDLIGENNSTAVIAVVVEALEKKVKTCIVDISDLRYINSSGIGLLITILPSSEIRAEKFINEPSESVQKLLVITKLNAIFKLFNQRTKF